jgi:PQQ-dependent catabolism-associated CXXCW motif protein
MCRMSGWRLAPAARADEGVPEPDGYRLDNYRGPTPATLRGASILDTRQAKELWQAGAATFVDVLPRPLRPANLPPGTVWRDAPRASVPGAVWLPNVGYGALSSELESYFRRALEALTQGRRDTPLVFFCQRHCWMSWNAAKRALDEGYGAVAWYPEGTDGWAEADAPLAPVEPFP